MAEKVTMRYNPFKVEFYIDINGKKLSKGSTIYENNKKRFGEWVGGITELLCEEVNDDFDITFYGTDLDYNDLKEDVDDFNAKNKDCKVSIEYGDSRSVENRIDDLKEIFAYMQESSPFEELKSEEVIRNFNKAMGVEFEIAIIATMSSGKSTLLNSLIGCELMPSKNEACTATIARIKSIKDDNSLYLSVTDKEGNVTENIDYKEINKNNIEKISDSISDYNSDENVSYIDIEYKLPFVDSNSLDLVLIDTPGPNNSRDEGHKETTYRIINDENPMVLYILNGTQLATNDDNTLLADISKAMKNGGKQAKDRFIFVANKMDGFDPEEEDLDKVYSNIKEYLKSHDIETHNIYFTSAEFAKLLRINKNGYEFTKKQKTNYDVAISTLKDLRLDEHAPLSPSGKKAIEDMMTASKADEDKALIYTGIPSVEVAINEYLKKYAIAIKIKDAYDAFKNIIIQKKFEKNLSDELNQNKEKREVLSKSLTKIKDQIEDGKEAEKCRENIKNLNIENDIEESRKTALTKLDTTIHKCAPKKEEGSEAEADKYIEKVKNILNDTQMKIKVDLEKSLDISINESAKNLMNEYKKYLDSLLDEMNISDFEFQDITLSEIITLYIDDTKDMTDKYKETKEVIVGTVSDATWWKPFSWFSTRDIYEDEEYINLSKIYGDIVQKANYAFRENIEATQEVANNEAKKFKEFFLDEMDKLDAKVKEKISSLNDIVKDQETVENTIEKNEEKSKWLDDFQKRLDDVIDV